MTGFIERGLRAAKKARASQSYQLAEVVLAKLADRLAKARTRSSARPAQTPPKSTRNSASQ